MSAGTPPGRAQAEENHKRAQRGKSSVSNHLCAYRRDEAVAAANGIFVLSCGHHFLQRLLTLISSSNAWIRLRGGLRKNPSFILSFRAVRGISEIEIDKNSRDSSHGSE
jgi:hypothetical protein